jgi:DNA-binding PadR family transcriptional regulator
MGNREQLTATECAALGLLSFGEASGYDLMKLAERSVGLMWQPVKSQLYALLPQFVERGFAVKRLVEQHGRPNKVLYRPTDAGRETLRTSLIELEPEGRAAKAVFNFKVFFGDIVGAEHVRETIEARREWVAERQSLLEQVKGRADPEEDFFPLLTLELGQEELAAFERWAERVLARLEAQAGTESPVEQRSAR